MDRVDRAFDRRGAYKSIMRPCLSVAFADDRMIPPPVQRAMAERAGATVSETPGGYAIYGSNPDAVAAVFRGEDGAREELSFAAFSCLRAMTAAVMASRTPWVPAVTPVVVVMPILSVFR